MSEVKFSMHAPHRLSERPFSCLFEFAWCWECIEGSDVPVWRGVISCCEGVICRMEK